MTTTYLWEAESTPTAERTAGYALAHDPTQSRTSALNAAVIARSFSGGRDAWGASAESYPVSRKAVIGRVVRGQSKFEFAPSTSSPRSSREGEIRYWMEREQFYVTNDLDIIAFVNDLEGVFAGMAKSKIMSQFASGSIQGQYSPHEISTYINWLASYINLLARIAGSHVPPELREALHDLNEAREEAREEEFPEPSEAALRNARRLLRAMYGISPQRFEVYPTPDGEIAIDAPGDPGRSVLLLCDSDGGALCLVNMDDAYRRARYSSADRLPDGFVREALDELKQRGCQAA